MKMSRPLRPCFAAPAACAALVMLLPGVLADVIRAQALERELYVSVLDRNGAPVKDIGASEFIIRENAAQREVLRVTPATDPMEIAIVVDNSQAATPAVPYMRDGLQSFIERLAGKNRIALITTGDRPTIVVDYTTDRDSLIRGVERLFAQPGSGSYVLQGLVEVAHGIERREAARPVIVLVTTEGVEFSDRHYDQVLEPLKKSGAAFHALVLGSGEGDLASDAGRNRGIVLDRGTRETGGRRDNLLSALALPGRLEELATELSSQYRVVYARPQSLIQPDKIEVSVTRSGLTARGTPIKPTGKG